MLHQTSRLILRGYRRNDPSTQGWQQVCRQARQIPLGAIRALKSSTATPASQYGLACHARRPPCAAPLHCFPLPFRFFPPLPLTSKTPHVHLNNRAHRTLSGRRDSTNGARIPVLGHHPAYWRFDQAVQGIAVSTQGIPPLFRRGRQGAEAV